MLRSGLHVFMYLVLFTAAQLCWNRKWAIPKRFPQSWEDEIVQNVLLWWALTVPCTGIKRPNSWKPNVPHGTVQSDKYCPPGNFQTQTHPLIRQTENCDLSLQRKRSTAPELSGGIVYITNTNIVLGDVRLGWSCSSMETSSMKLSLQWSWANLQVHICTLCTSVPIYIYTCFTPAQLEHPWFQWHKGLFYLLTLLSHFMWSSFCCSRPLCHNTLWTCCILL